MTKLVRGFLTAIAALLLLTFLDRFVLVELLARRLALPLLLAALTALAAIGTGSIARRKGADPLLDFAVGYPLLGTVCFLIGLLRVSAWTMLVPVIGLALAGAIALERWYHSADRSSEASLPPAAESKRFWSSETLATAAIALLLLAGFVAAQAPPASLDELAYHLAVPQTWVLEGRVVELPLNSHSYFPLGIESADLPLLATLGPASGGVSSHLLHLFSAVVATLLIYRRCKDRLITAAIVSTPALALTAGWSLVDWPLLAICVAFLDDDDSTRSAALAAGLLTKYTFIPYALVVVIVTRRWRHLWPGAIVGSVFFIRNLVLTGNPVAPFLGSDAPHVAGYRSLTLGSYIFDGKFVDESLGASLFAALTLSWGLLPLALIVAGGIFWSLAPSARLLMPFFGTAAALAQPATSRVLRIIIGIAIVSQLLLVSFHLHRTKVFSLISGERSEDEYLGDVRPAYRTITWLNEALPAGSRTLVIGLNETYWFERPVRGGGNFDGPRVSAYVEAPTPEALRARLRAGGITHVAVISNAIQTADDKKLEERTTALTPRAQRSLSQMLDRHASSVAARENAVLFTLR